MPFDNAAKRFNFPRNTLKRRVLHKNLRNNPGRIITRFQVSKLLGEAFLRAAVPQTAINGFCKFGIFPSDPNVFSNADFVATEVSDIPMNSVNTQCNVSEDTLKL